MIVWGSDVSTSERSKSVLPIRILRVLGDLNFDKVLEIRLRANLPIRIKTFEGKFFVSKSHCITKNIENSVIATGRDIEDAIEILSCNSLYSIEDELSNGYITTLGGCRVGIVGSVVQKDDKISFIKNITGLNYRFPKEIIGAANSIFRDAYNGGKIRSTLIISPPGGGKTTLLRDLIRQISNKSVNVSVIDERGELGAEGSGQATFDLGFDTDIMDNCKKTEGMSMVIRCMGPEVVAVDEIGSNEEIQSVFEAMKCGVKVFATIHGLNRAELLCDSRFVKLLGEFDLVVTLMDREITEVILQ